VFLGKISCELELERCHSAFEGLRFFLVEPQHEVDWKGLVIAVDMVEAEVGDWVLVALPPFGSKVELPPDLPVQGAVVAVVDSITTLDEETEDSRKGQEESPLSPPLRGASRNWAPERERGGSAPRSRSRPRQRSQDSKRGEKAPFSRGSEGHARGKDLESPKPAPKKPVESKEPSPEPPLAPKAPEPSTKAPKPSTKAPKPPTKQERSPEPPESGGSEEPRVVWDTPKPGTGSSVKSKSPRRRR